MKRNSLVLIASTITVLGFFGLNTAIGADAARQNQAAPKEARGQKKDGIKVTFVELGSVNCIPCKMMQPVMADIEKEYVGQVKVVFHDVWTKEGRPYGDKYKIRAIPTQVFLDRDGKEFFRHTGFFPKEEIVKVLRKQGVQ